MMSDSVETAKESLKQVIHEVEANKYESKQVELQQSSNSTSMSPFDDEVWPLSKPNFNFILTRTHVKPRYRMVFPPRLHSYLPSAIGSSITIPTTILCRGKTWETNICVDSKRKRLNKNWKAFVVANGLKAGDALFWEVLGSSNEKVEFRVQVVKGDFPAELEAKVNGKTKDTPIIID